jgi:flagellar assembly factor FliW
MMTLVTLPPQTDRALHFVEPLPGFDDEDAYTLSDIDPDGVLLAMRSVRDPGLRFVLSPAEVFFEGYEPEFGPEVLDSLGATDASDLRILLMLTIGTELADGTANLRAPVVVCDASGRARQVVLEDESLPMRHPLLG